MDLSHFVERLAASVDLACELKSTIVMASTRIAHLSFVGDSLIGADVNLEAGVVVPWSAITAGSVPMPSCHRARSSRRTRSSLAWNS